MFKTGKLPIPLLDSLLKKYAVKSKDLVIGPGIGMDAAVVKFGNTFLAAKTDPITFTSFELGEYLVNINANDIACMGGVPKYLLATLLLPEKDIEKKGVEKIFRELSVYCRALGISLCGGHTEITAAVSRPVAVGAMFGEVRNKKRVYPASAREGDEVILVKGIAIEGTAILAMEKKQILEERFGASFVRRASEYIKNPGISVLKEAETAWDAVNVRAMHDPTEQGISGALFELGERMNMGMAIEEEKISILPECGRICGYFGLNPLGLISSGALLAVVKKRDGERLVQIYKRKKTPASIIGRVIKKKGVWFATGKGLRPFPFFKRDEITKVI